MSLKYISILMFFTTAFISRGQTVVIDAGHGYCSDCTQNCTPNVRSTIEIETAMIVSNKLDSLLQNCSTITSYLTRPTSDCGDFPSLAQRALMSNNWNADRFLSVHCNAGGGTGTETFWCDNSPSSNAQCQSFATEVQTQMVNYGQWNGRRVVEDHTYLAFHLGVLSPTNAVGCLSEIGFVDHSNDVTKLLSAQWRDSFAQGYLVALQNDLSFSCTAASVPDLVIESMWTVPANPNVGENVDLFVNILNVGNGPANAISLDFKMDNTTLGSVTHTSLGANQMVTKSLNNHVFTSADNYDYCVYIDPASSEQNTINNSYCINVSVGNEEDVQVINPTVSPLTISAGDQIDVTASQIYAGNQSSAVLPDFDLAYYLSTDCTLSLDDVLLGTDQSSIGTNNSSESENSSFIIPSNTADGTYYIIFSGDDSDDLMEIDETNNTACVQFTVDNNTSGSEDIFLSNAVVTPLIINPGDIIDVSVTQNYVGNHLAVNLPDFKLGYYLSTDCVLSSNDIFLGIDSSNIGSDFTAESEIKTLTVPTSTPDGIYYVLFSADDENELLESDEANNVICVEIVVENTLSLENHSFQDKITVYPNPTTGVVNISTNEKFFIARLMVYDLNGKIYKSNKGSNLDKVNIKDVPPGVYFLKILNNKEQEAIFRIVKQ
ncbi:N-acetylmuramoyl-L-alanine amidase [Brumimicrobium aurantiacum]|uniref:N-acetylmuramoyl-L-alanine amidase n=1 Tax=Brumimicrobium aurantiacum TaxID=1737063 RepID=A0A3E1F1B7_9FLAO|nr:N-acetylmuramoyl-L-alanine amidase [Brumimicrobium aurantiacum]RFC55539.1 T9SS C-terminal target domain-containing protein [Brumimicrobium aurantiacum]